MSIGPQAFLELGTEEAAITMVNYYSTVTPHVRNVPVFIQYSNHKELKTDAGNQRAQAVLQAVSAVQGGGTPTSGSDLALTAASSPVLRIIIDNMFYPVTLDVLQQVTNNSLCIFSFSNRFVRGQIYECKYTFFFLWLSSILYRRDPNQWRSTGWQLFCKLRPNFAICDYFCFFLLYFHALLNVCTINSYNR